VKCLEKRGQSTISQRKIKFIEHPKQKLISLTGRPQSLNLDVQPKKVVIQQNLKSSQQQKKWNFHSFQGNGIIDLTNDDQSAQKQKVLHNNYKNPAWDIVDPILKNLNVTPPNDWVIGSKTDIMEAHEALDMRDENYEEKMNSRLKGKQLFSSPAGNQYVYVILCETDIKGFLGNLDLKKEYKPVDFFFGHTPTELVWLADNVVKGCFNPVVEFYREKYKNQVNEITMAPSSAYQTLRSRFKCFILQEKQSQTIWDSKVGIGGRE